eukprot:COSAG06_NODE_6328_length_2982_cov_2.371488_2_plen_29_part_01
MLAGVALGLALAQAVGTAAAEGPCDILAA